MMTRYVDVEKLTQRIMGADYIHTACEVLIEIDCMPKEDVAPVIHGHWVDTYGHSLFECSACNCEFSDNIVLLNHYDMFPKYCPNCGAKMDDEVAE